MKKGNIKIYDVDYRGKYRLKEQLNEKDYLLKSDLIKANNKIIQDKLSSEIYDNPFLCELNTYDSDLEINIERFCLMNNGQTCTVSSIVHSDYYNKKQKKKILKTQFNKWIDEAKSKIDRINVLSKNTINVSKKCSFKTVNLLNKVLLFTGIVLPIVLLLNVIPFINFTSKIHIICAIIVIVLSIVGLIFCFFQNRKKRIYDEKIYQHKKNHITNLKRIKKDFKNKSKKLICYYSKGYKNNQFIKKPLRIEYIQININKLLKVENSISEIQKYHNKEKNNKVVSGLSYNIAVCLSYFVTIISGGYIVFMIFVYLFKLIFMKGE